MRLFLGVDGGQSGTTALVGDESGRVIGVGQAGPCNHVGTEQGRTRFLTSLSASVAAASGGNSVRFDAACMGFSGGPADKDAFAREIVPSDRYQITSDTETALLGALGGGPGIVTIAGTGSVAFGHSSSGTIARAGGWGYVFGDEGSAFDIVRQALRSALRFEEGWGPPTDLGRRLCQSEGATNSNELMHWFYRDDYPRSRVAALAVHVAASADEGDQVAQSILADAGRALAELVGAVKLKSFKPGESVAVSYVGGVFQNRRVLERFRILVEMDDQCSVAAPMFGPAAGALMGAYRLAGLSPALKDVPEDL